MSHRIYAFISDGGIQEEISQGAGRIAGFLGLNNLIVFYDSNDIQLSTQTEAVSNEDTARKYESWGWKVIMINGNDQDQIRNALTQGVNEKEKPTLIIGKTIMGKGAMTDDDEKFEREVSTHGMPLSKAGASFEKTIEKLGGNPNDPFEVSITIREHYKEIIEKKRKAVKERKTEEEKWRKKHPELADTFDQFFIPEVPEIDYDKIEMGEGIATRAASKAVLATFAEKVENMIVASADFGIIPSGWCFRTNYGRYS
jgi:transketolase